MQGILLRDDQREAIRTLREQGFAIREISHQESALTSWVRSCWLSSALTSEGMIDYTLTLGGFLNRREETKEVTHDKLVLTTHDKYVRYDF